MNECITYLTGFGREMGCYVKNTVKKQRLENLPITCPTILVMDFDPSL